MADARSALIISSPPATKRRTALVRALERAGFRVLTPDRTRQAEAPDLVVALGPMTVLAEVKLMRAVAPHVPIFVAWVGRPEERFLSEAYAAGANSVVPAERVDVAWKNLLRVLTETKGGASAVRLRETLVPSFHDETGRLDAARIAEVMGLTLSQIAKAIGVTTSALSKRPNAAAAQAGLRELEFSWATLLEMLGEMELARAWLHAGHPDFSGEPPLHYLIEGGAKRLGDYLRAAVAGETA
jgi:transcriptional regulator with XRE-family HTH domain